VLQKSFLAGDGNFLDPLVRFARRDVRVHIGSHKNDHGPPYPSYRVLQRRRRQKIDFREIFGVARFSTFATKSAQNGNADRIPRCPVSGAKRKTCARIELFRFWPLTDLGSSPCHSAVDLAAIEAGDWPRLKTAIRRTNSAASSGFWTARHSKLSEPKRNQLLPSWFIWRAAS